MGRLAAVAAALIGATLLGTPAAAAQSEVEPVQVAVTVNGREADSGTIELDPAEQAEVSVTVVNQAGRAQRVRTIRISGSALGLPLFAYDTTIPFDVPAGGRVTRSFPLDVRDLGGQAVGLLPAEVELLDNDRVALGSAGAVVDVRGSLWSVYGLFGVVLLAMTALTWTSALLARAGNRLSPSRARRALRFLAPGVGAGLTLVVWLSVLRLVPPETAVAVPVLVGATLAALAVGYLSPYRAPAPQWQPEPAPAAETTYWGNPR